MKILYKSLIFLTLCFGFVQYSAAHDAHKKQCVKDLSWYVPASNKTIAPQKMMKKIRKKKVILLGEHHDNDEHHRWQLQVIHSLFAYKANLVLAFEMFPRKVQPVLDKWVAGELTEKEFLKQSEWSKHWTYDSNFYMPIFHFARMNRIPMRAVNIDRAFINRIQEEGLENIPIEQRQGLKKPAEFSQEYIDFMQAVFQKHGPPDKKNQKLDDKQKKMFDKFIQVQALWDAAMAQGIDQAMQDYKGYTVVGVMGSGHMANGFGVPLQLRSLNINNIATLVPWHEQFQCDQLTDKFADVVVGLPGFTVPVARAKPKLGIYMEPVKGGGVRIKKVYENTVASQSGLRDQDIIVEMAGRRISNMGEIVEIVQGMVLGSWLPITVQRDDQKKAVIAKFPTRAEPN